MKQVFTEWDSSKHIIPMWKAWLYRIMFWKYKEVIKGVFIIKY